MDEETPCADCRGSGVFPSEDGEWVSCICPAGFERCCANLDVPTSSTLYPLNPMERVTPLESEVRALRHEDDLATRYEEIERLSRASAEFGDRVAGAAKHWLKRCLQEPGAVTSVSSYPRHEAVGNNDSRAKVRRYAGK